MKKTMGNGIVTGVVVTALISMFLLGGCGRNPVSSNPPTGTYSGGTVDGKGTKGGNVGASAVVPADTAAVSGAN